jgi:hypothetical protein
MSVSPFTDVLRAVVVSTLPAQKIRADEEGAPARQLLREGYRPEAGRDVRFVTDRWPPLAPPLLPARLAKRGWSVARVQLPGRRPRAS